MPNYTSNLKLTQPLVSELYDINVQNKNMDEIDKAIGEINANNTPPFTEAGNPIRKNLSTRLALAPTVEFTAREIEIGTKSTSNPSTIVGLDKVYAQVQIGNRNLLLNSSEEYVSGEACYYGYWDLAKETYNHGIVLEADQIYALSFDWTVDWGDVTPCQVMASPGCAKAPGGFTTDLTTKYIINNAASAPTSGRCTFSFSATAEQLTNAPYFAMRYVRTNGETELTGTTWTITNLKLEKSASASDYTPAPEDAVESSLMAPTAWCDFESTMYGAKVDFAAGKWYQTWNVYVLDGTESVERLEYYGAMRYFINVPNRIPSKDASVGVCSHFAYNYHPISQNAMDNSFTVYTATGNVYGRCDSIGTVEDMKAFLAAQYAAGTPVTIAYWMAEPIEHDFNPGIINALVGENTFYTNGDDLEITYNHELMLGAMYQAMKNAGGGVPKDHTQPADSITAGTLAGKVQANAAAAAVVSTPQLRDIVMTTTDPGAGATVDYPDGTVIHVYE